MVGILFAFQRNGVLFPTVRLRQPSWACVRFHLRRFPDESEPHITIGDMYEQRSGFSIKTGWRRIIFQVDIEASFARKRRKMQEQANYAIGWGTLSLINAGLAQSKGRSGLLWWLASLLFGPLATLIIVVLPAVESIVTVREGGRRSLSTEPRP